MIPKPLLSMMDGIRGKGLQSEGIFRISANFKKVKVRIFFLYFL